MSGVEAYISVGSNLGDKAANCRYGIEALVGSGACRLLVWSRFYRTEPVDMTDQDWFVNAVVKVETDLAAEDLLTAMLRVEKEAGRVRGGERFGPRTLDLDLIFYGDRVIDLEAVRVPHPRMHKRRFVLKPICDINPSLRHPLLGQTVRQLLDGLDPSEQKVEAMSCAC
jgi:2-amino-4-hydroxy-6-hydroxymethyldihydropteridine diphosphokinase